MTYRDQTTHTYSGRSQIPTERAGATMSDTAPLWIIFAVQAVSVAGDTLGQRASRRFFKHNSRRMLIVLSVVSALQVLVVLAAVQLVLPASTTGAIYKGRTALPCYEEVDLRGRAPSYCDGRNCTEVACPSQGPFSIPRTVGLHPLILLNGLQGIVYYIGEVMLYQHPLGLVLLVMSSLVSSFVITPFEALFGIREASVGPVIVALGIIGAVACVFEVPLTDAQRRSTLRAMYAGFARACRRGACVRGAVGEPDGGDVPVLSDDDITATQHQSSAVAPATPGSDAGPYSALDDADADATAGAAGDATPYPARQPLLQRIARHTLAVGAPFLALATVYSTWFVSQKVFNDQFRTNAFGYTALDQVLNPFFLLPVLLAFDSITPLKRCVVPPKERGATFAQDWRLAWQEALVRGGVGGGV